VIQSISEDSQFPCCCEHHLLQRIKYFAGVDCNINPVNFVTLRTDVELTAVKSKALDAKREVDNSNHHVVSYELEWLEFCASEANAAADIADQEWLATRRNNHLAKLAVALGDIERQRRNLEAKRRVLEEKQAELAPLLDRLKGWGTALARSLSEELTSVAADLECTLTNLTIRRDLQQGLEIKAKDFAVERSELNRALADTKSFGDKRRYQRDQLGSQGLLESNERADDGLTRWIPAAHLIDVVIRFWRDFFKRFRPTVALVHSEHHVS
jgi:chromosome segregation ATPase